MKKFRSKLELNQDLTFQFMALLTGSIFVLRVMFEFKRWSYQFTFKENNKR